jgi:hypothetical protein
MTHIIGWNDLKGNKGFYETVYSNKEEALKAIELLKETHPLLVHSSYEQIKEEAAPVKKTAKEDEDPMMTLREYTAMEPRMATTFLNLWVERQADPIAAKKAASNLMGQALKQMLAEHDK